MREQWNAFYRMYRWMLRSAPYPDDVLIALYESKIVPASWVHLLGEDDPMNYYGKTREDRWVLRLYRMRVIMLQKGLKMSRNRVSELLKKLPSNKI